MKPLFSPSMLITYADCSFKFYLSFIAKAKPERRKDFEYGKDVHRVISKYYELIPERMTRREVPLFLSQALNKSATTGSNLEKALRGFMSFEEERLSWNLNAKPEAVEKYFERGLFCGVVDAVFLRKGGGRIGVDWKTSWKVDTANIHYIIQGFIYIYVARLDEMIFVPIHRGSLVKLSSTELPIFKNRVISIIQGIRARKFEKNVSDKCSSCEFNLVCKQGDKVWDTL